MKLKIYGNCITKKLIVFSLFSLLLVSCNSKYKLEESPVLENSIIVIKPNLERVQLDISAILDTVRFVKLEIVEKSIIGKIDKLIVFEDRIYLLDNQTSSLFVFNMDGKFIFKISKIGHGPGEYTQLDYFDIDFENRQIVLTDLTGYWILKYDLEGNYISRKKIPFWIEGVAPVLNNGTVVYANHRDNKHVFEQEYNLFYLDSSMKISKAYFPYNSSDFINPTIKFSTPETGDFYTYNKNRHFFSPYKNQVYQVTEEGLKSKYLFDFKEEGFNEEYLSQKTDLYQHMKKGEFYQLAGVFENEDVVIFSFYQRSNGIGHLGYYSKNNKKSICSLGFTAGKNNYFHGNTIAAYNSWIIAKVKPEELLSWVKTIDKNTISPENEYSRLKKNIADSVSQDDNPLLMFYKLKQF